MNAPTTLTAADCPLVARAHRHLSRLDATIQRHRFNARAKKLAAKLRAQLALTEAEERPILAANPHLTGLAYFLADYEAAIDSACWDGEPDYFARVCVAPVGGR